MKQVEIASRQSDTGGLLAAIAEKIQEQIERH
jgi:hypothetical protein